MKVRANGHRSMEMNPITSCLDPETLAAFIDRRLPAEERRRVEEHLVECPDCYEVFIEAVRFLQEEGDLEIGEDRPVAPVRRGPWPGRKALRVALPLAATVILAVGVWVVVQAGWLGGAGRLPAAGDLVAGLDAAALAPGQVEHLVDDHGWPRSRGGAASPGLTGGEPVVAAVDPDVAFRFGALHTDLELALRRDDLERRVAVQLVQRLTALVRDELQGWDPLIFGYRNLRDRLEAGAPTPQLLEITSALAERAQEQVGEAPYRLGAWAEAGRLAAAAGTVEPLRSGDLRETAELLDREALPPGLAAAVGRAMEAAERAASADDLARAESAFAELVRLGGHPWHELGSAAPSRDGRDGHALPVPRDAPGDQG
jgi:hypothetical protein